jgi:hypothetical protein
MQRHPTAPVNVAKISVATFRTDFIAPRRISQRSSGLPGSVRGDHILSSRSARAIRFVRNTLMPVRGRPECLLWNIWRRF